MPIDDPQTKPDLADGGYCAIAVTDLDGTLLDGAHRLTRANRRALHELGEAQVLRVVATGRSPFSALKVIDSQFPIDYLVCSSGAVIKSWPDGELLRTRDLPGWRAIEVAEKLRGLELDFMLHAASPDNHRFWYHRTSRDNQDFESRLARYQSHALPLESDHSVQDGYSQLLVVEPPDSPSVLESLRDQFDDLHVILATSPLDLVSRWLEVFPAEVSKASAAAWIAEQCGISAHNSFAIGNDYNDLSMLEWATTSIVVANAPEDMRARFDNVPSHGASGFATGARRWLEAIKG